jgi:ATP-dependent helicase/nuclease subunit B
LREAHHDNCTAALVTPDRTLARRVMAALARWNLAIDDSGGDALMETPAGVFARLTAQAATQGLAPATLLALLKHPRFRLGRAEGAWHDATATLELALLRGPRPEAGTAGLACALATFRTDLEQLQRGEMSALHRAEPRARLSMEECAQAQDLVAQLTAALAPLERQCGTTDTHFGALAEAHDTVLTALGDDGTSANAAFDGPDGVALAVAFAALRDIPDAAALPVSADDYADALSAALSDRIVRRAGVPGARLRIYGPLEARLTRCDRIILGGLNEGKWPPQTTTDAWLSRPMRHHLGLDLPERRIGLSAHDFVQLAGTARVILSRATKTEGTPAVPSRFLNRLQAVSGNDAWGAALKRGARYLALAHALDHAQDEAPIGPPHPRPPVDVRPTRLPVTDIEHWLRDPYTIYAKYILRLPHLDPVDQRLNMARRGAAVHGALGDFTQRFADALPGDIEAELLGCGERHFAPLMTAAEARALWWPRFLRIAAWFAHWERERRPRLASVFAELSGSMTITTSGRPFTLTARADRIDRLADGRYAILDYKTGEAPTGKMELIGIAPQLTLEAAILRAGGFPGIPPGSHVGELMYVRLTGNDPAGHAEPLALTHDKRKIPPLSPDDGAENARNKLAALVAAFEDPETSYRSLQMPLWKNRYGAYDDLARVKEWSETGGATDGEGGGDDA